MNRKYNLEQVNPLEVEENVPRYVPSRRIADNIKKLKEKVFRTIENRERLPQPLFWSLFHAQLSEIYKQRETDKKKRAAFLGVAQE